MKRFFVLIIVLVVLSGCSYNNIQNKPTLSAQNNDKEALAPTTVLSYSDVVDKKNQLFLRKFRNTKPKIPRFIRGKRLSGEGKFLTSTPK